MSERIAIKATEQGVVRVFAVDLPDDALKAFNARNGTWPLRDALGADTLDIAHIEVFPVSDLKGVGLAGYLDQGLGIPDDQIEGMRPQLAALTGAVLILRSAAFGGVAQDLTPRAPLRLIATFSEADAPISFAPLPADGAQGHLAQVSKPRPSNAAMSGRIATIALLALFALVGLMIWVAS